MQDGVHDLAIIGGGINGCGIARDAQGRGLSVVLVEQGDLGGATSSASTSSFTAGSDISSISNSALSARR